MVLSLKRRVDKMHHVLYEQVGALSTSERYHSVMETQGFEVSPKRGSGARSSKLEKLRSIRILTLVPPKK